MGREVQFVVTVAVGLAVVGALIGLASGQVINIQEVSPLDAELNGYGEGTDAPSHLIDVGGDFRFSGEAAHNVRIEVTGSDWTVLDMSSVSIRIEGDEPVVFDRRFAEDTVVLAADEVPADTIVEIRFQTVFVGGNDDEQIPVADVRFRYETAGGTVDSTTFTAEADMDESANRVVSDLRGENPDRWQVWLSYVAIGLIILFAVLGVKRWRDWKSQGYPSDDDESLGPGDGPPP